MTPEQKTERLEAAIDYMLILASEKDPHLGHPRLSDKNCIFCMGYFALNDGAYGYSITTDEYKKLSEEKRANFKKKINMSTELHDIKDTRILSDCCGAPIYADVYICTECQEHCGVETEEIDPVAINELTEKN